MTVITQNLPCFIKDLHRQQGIIGLQECYTWAVENLDIGDVKCLKCSLSKGLDVGIVVGGYIMQAPHIILVVIARSARGLSFPACILETLSYAITLAYSFRHRFPFSTYRENFFLTLQNVLVTLLIFAFAPFTLSPSRSSKAHKIATSIILTLLSTIARALLLAHYLSLLQFTTLPLSIFSKLPQVTQNHCGKSTGQLSAFSVVSPIAGCLARLFRMTQEAGDSLVVVGFVLALAWNIMLGAQL